MIYKFSDREIKILLNNLTIIVDKREQQNDHIINYFKKHKRKYIKQSLKEGDYSALIPYNLETAPILESVGLQRDMYLTNEVLIERKGSLDEIAGNLCNRNAKYDVYGNQIVSENKERERFKFELTRIRNCGAKCFLFIEDKNGHENLRLGKYRSQYKPESFLASIKSFQAEFDFNLQFLGKDVIGSEIFYSIYYTARDFFKQGNLGRFITIDEAEVLADE